MYFEIYPVTPAGLTGAAAILSTQWRWRLKAANHEPIASGESYYNRSDCLHAINLIKGTNYSTPIYDEDK